MRWWLLSAVPEHMKLSLHAINANALLHAINANTWSSLALGVELMLAFCARVVWEVVDFMRLGGVEGSQRVPAIRWRGTGSGRACHLPCRVAWSLSLAWPAALFIGVPRPPSVEAPRASLRCFCAREGATSRISVPIKLFLQLIWHYETK